MEDPTICKFTVAARKIGNLPENWHGWIFGAVTGALLVTGAVCPPVTRGPRKADPDTKRTVAIPAQMLE